MSAQISIIVAVAQNNVIGGNNKLPWNLSADLKHFKKLTMGNSVVMGRKTFDSIGKPLPGRHIIIITRQKDYACEGCDVAHSLEEAISLAKSKEVFIAGGGEIYHQALPLAQKIYLTRVHTDATGDTKFPQLAAGTWMQFSKKNGAADAKNDYDHTFFELRNTEKLTSLPLPFFQEFNVAVTVCDAEGIILYMNEKSKKTFEKYGAGHMLGKNLLECHPEPARSKLSGMLATQDHNAYTIEKNGIKKLIFQEPWYDAGKYMGFVELSLEIPMVMQHFVRE